MLQSAWSVTFVAFCVVRAACFELRIACCRLRAMFYMLRVVVPYCLLRVACCTFSPVCCECVCVYAWSLASFESVHWANASRWKTQMKHLRVCLCPCSKFSEHLVQRLQHACQNPEKRMKFASAKSPAHVRKNELKLACKFWHTPSNLPEGLFAGVRMIRWCIRVWSLGYVVYSPVYISLANIRMQKKMASALWVGFAQ